MPEGIEVFNDNNRLVLSSNLQNPVLRASGSVTTITNTLTPSFNTSMFYIPYTKVTGSFPLCAIRPTTQSFYYGIERYPVLAGVNDLRFYFISNLAVGASVPYWIFDTPPAASGNVGLEIYDSTGALNFSIQNKPLRIADVIGGNFSGLITPQSLTYTTGRTYAAICGRWTSYQLYRALPDRTDSWGLGVRGITDGIERSRMKYEEVSGNNAGTINQQQQIIIADVTGY